MANRDKETAAVLIIPAMMFAQRFALYFNIRDRSTIAIDVSINIEAPTKNPSVI